MLRIGSNAPEIDSKLEDGTPFRLSALRGSPVVLYFYPRDETPGCTRQACSFRDRHSELVAAGARLFGVSSDPADSHAAFRKRHALPFPLLSDSDGAIRRAYDVKKLLGLLPERVTYVIDREGVIRAAIHRDFLVDRNVDEAIQAVKAL